MLYQQNSKYYGVGDFSWSELSFVSHFENQTFCIRGIRDSKIVTGINHYNTPSPTFFGQGFCRDRLWSVFFENHRLAPIRVGIAWSGETSIFIIGNHKMTLVCLIYKNNTFYSNDYPPHNFNQGLICTLLQNIHTVSHHQKRSHRFCPKISIKSFESTQVKYDKIVYKQEITGTLMSAITKDKLTF